ncbi:inositol phospholipid synthesis and fat-storage-inducing TM-domain-containing protein [Gymnopilus junonius]|uniref:Inositol phospholipid synthesis and fat-storage-inducing TM-domain-containing protein n=1 Tax=Gymnopilus junonius TaxID=109634 RepID=A0A9P5NL69_GYMJU|nr:inositol phospholipid synthesis and fat-storage-inducing TM-domain-containing protein [Gymnopilus junonius]
MTDLRLQTLLTVTAILLLGSAYSVLYGTYLDTSNPHLTHLPHHLADTHFFASKSNPLNVYFIKKSWGWTSLVFLFSYLTSPPQIRTRRRLSKFLFLTSVWVLFTSWFFGPALLDRFTVYSGGECVYQLPDGHIRNVPIEVCYTKSAISPETHKHLFSDNFAGLPEGWRIVPRIRRGHDFSGHVFLLTMATLLLADQLRASFKFRAWWSGLHMWAVAANIALMGIWLLGTYTTSVYFHSPFEKFTGYLLGVTSFAVSQLPIFS